MEGLGGSDNLSILTPSEIGRYAELLYDVGTRKFKIVGGEPTLRTDLPKIIEQLRQLDTRIDLSMVTNGVKLKRFATQYIAAGLNRINVSLFTLDESYFVKHVGPRSQLQRVVEGIDELVCLEVPGKINHVYHDMEDLARIVEFAARRGRRVNVLNEIPSIGSNSLGLSASQLSEILWTNLDISDSKFEDDPYSLPVTVLSLAGGGEIEFKHLEVGEQDKFASCANCGVRDRCREGILAIRLTTAGAIQPCMVRDDNSFNLVDNPTSRALSNYLAEL